MAGTGDRSGAKFTEEVLLKEFMPLSNNQPPFPALHRDSWKISRRSNLITVHIEISMFKMLSLLLGRVVRREKR